MIPRSLLLHQQAGEASYLTVLQERCARRFREAAILAGADLAQWPVLDRWTEHRAPLGPLLPFWATLCARYNDEIHDPQPDMLRPTDTPEELFSRFVCWRLFPLLVAEQALALQEWPLSIDMSRLDPGWLE